MFQDEFNFEEEKPLDDELNEFKPYINGAQYCPNQNRYIIFESDINGSDDYRNSDYFENQLLKRYQESQIQLQDICYYFDYTHPGLKQPRDIKDVYLQIVNSNLQFFTQLILLLQKFTPNILYLDLGNQMMGGYKGKEVIKAISHMTGLNELFLNFNNNDLQDDFAKKLALIILNIESLEVCYLYLANNFIEFDGANQIFIAFQKHIQLRKLKLNFYNNQIGFQGMETLVENSYLQIHSLKSLSLNIMQNCLPYQWIQQLASDLVSLESLQQIQFPENYLDLLTLPALQQNNLKTIKIFLPIAHSDLYREISDSLLLCQSMNILHLVFGQQTIYNQNLLNLNNIWNCQLILKELNLELQENFIGNIGTQTLVSFLTSFPKLKTLKLNLSKNQFDLQGVILILQALILLDQLSTTKLLMCKNQCIAGPIQCYLKSNKQLQNFHLSLAKSMVRSSFFETYLSQFIQCLVAVKTLKLNFSKIEFSNDGMQNIFTGISFIPKLESIDLNFSNTRITQTNSKLLALGIIKLQSNLISFKINLEYTYFYDQQNILIALARLHQMKNCILSLSESFHECLSKFLKQLRSHLSLENFEVQFRHNTILNQVIYSMPNAKYASINPYQNNFGCIKTSLLNRNKLDLLIFRRRKNGELFLFHNLDWVSGKNLKMKQKVLNDFI